jgi:uncharacterized damage-inducible protein DinB
MEQKDFITEFREQANYRLDESTRMLTKCFQELEETDIWKRPNPSSNSVGNLILHLCGNMTQYAISSLGESSDIRNRDREFAADSGYPKSRLLEMLIEVVDRVKNNIRYCSAKQLSTSRKVQGFNLTGIGIVIHVVEHYSYHTGQIAFWTKILKDKDLKFYDGIDLNIKNP